MQNNLFLLYSYLQEDHPSRQSEVGVGPLVYLVGEGDGDGGEEDVEDLEAGVSQILLCWEEELAGQVGKQRTGQQ